MGKTLENGVHVVCACMYIMKIWHCNAVSFLIQLALMLCLNPNLLQPPPSITFSDLSSADAELQQCLPGPDSFPRLMPTALPTQLPPQLLPAQFPGAHVPQPMACFALAAALESVPVCIFRQAHALYHHLQVCVLV